MEDAMSAALKMNHVTEGAPMPKADGDVLAASESLAVAVEKERDLRRRIHNAKIELEELSFSLARAKSDVRKFRRMTVKASRRPLWQRIIEALNG